MILATFFSNCKAHGVELDSVRFFIGNVRLING